MSPRQQSLWSRRDRRSAPRGDSRSSGALWEIEFEDGLNTEEYARQIDFFKIEIGAVSKKGKIEYISRVTRPKPDKHVGDARSDYRLRIGWKKGTLHAADRKLLSKAGINSEGKDLFHYFPIEVQVQLADLERAYAKREPGDIRRTRFLLKPKTKADGYEFVVVEQDPPKPKEPAPASLNQPSVNPPKTRPDE